MEVSWSPSHDRHSPLSPSTRSPYDSDLSNLRRSLSRSPSRTDLRSGSSFRQLQSRSLRHGTPSKSRLRQETSSASGLALTEDNHPRSSAKQHRPVFARSSAIKTPRFSLFANEDSTTPQSARDFSATRDHGTLPIRSTPCAAGGSSTPIKRPMRRVLSTTSDNGNSATPQSPPPDAEGQENQPPSSPLFPNQITPPKINEPAPSDCEAPRKSTPQFRSRSREWRPAKSSPLKRSDAVMNLNYATSPAAKRRTICAGQISSPFESFRESEDRDTDATDSEPEIPTQHASFRTSLTPRAALQTRPAPFCAQHEVMSRTRRSLERPSESPRKPRSRLRHRLWRNTDNASQYSPLPSERGPLFGDAQLSMDQNDSHIEPPISRQSRATQPHPLSKALSPTSPTFPTSVSTESRFSDVHKATKLDFSKSLPIGALRQTGDSKQSSLESSQQASVSSLETPRKYELARPDPAAFRSTGLISKKHRNPEDIPPPPAGGHRMPDTPCKKGVPDVDFGASPTPDHSAFQDPRLAQPSFDSPSRPTQMQSTGRQPSSLRNASNIFGANSNFVSLQRCESFASLDGDDQGQALSQQGSQSSTEDLPPTPTKQASNSKSNSLRSSLFGRHPPLNTQIFETPKSQEPRQSTTPRASQDSPCKYSSQATLPKIEEAPVGSQAPTKCFVDEEAMLFLSPSSFARFRFGRQKSEVVSPMGGRSRRPHPHSSLRWKFAKPLRPSPVFRAPLPPSANNVVPQTPADNGFPDPSGLSISPGFKAPPSPLANHGFRISGSFTPATPTHRDHHHSPATPSTSLMQGHQEQPQDFDPVLTRKFKRVEWFAGGEFSNVYKVYESPRRSWSESCADDVYIVKKSKMPYHGNKLRESRLLEASIMAALSNSSSEGHDHVVRLIDSWEASGHLYIQTELCTDGNLEQFLSKIGNKDRLDDFRIWKILREACLGLLHIHNSGYIHLDLKPANIFIAFNGALKIGDFGLACRWPAPPYTEGEGDRRYIAPELLQGRIDKPADVFALGIIMFEIASNNCLPDNGKSWQRLRSGDFSDLEKGEQKSLTTLPSLTSGGSTNSLSLSLDRDSQTDFSFNTEAKSYDSLYPVDRDDSMGVKAREEVESTPPPPFAFDVNDPQSLDSVVHWMMHPDPDHRPTVQQILNTAGCQWVNERSRAAGATIDEGPWGPMPLLGRENADMDAEMLDV